MTLTAKAWKPETYPQVIPYLVVEGAGALMDFVGRVFDGVPAERLPGPDGHVQHGEVRIGASMVMMGRARTPDAKTTSMVYVYVPDVDATYPRALAAGATSVMAPADHDDDDDRRGSGKDAWGHPWWIATHGEPVPPDELVRRAAPRG